MLQLFCVDKQKVVALVQSRKSSDDEDGELMNNGFAFHKKSAMRTETSYNYTASQGSDTTSSCIVEIAQESATGYVDMPSDGEQVLMPTVAQQLVPIAFGTEQSSFKSYLSGV